MKTEGSGKASGLLCYCKKPECSKCEAKKEVGHVVKNGEMVKDPRKQRLFCKCCLHNFSVLKELVP